MCTITASLNTQKYHKQDSIVSDISGRMAYEEIKPECCSNLKCFISQLGNILGSQWLHNDGQKQVQPVWNSH